MARKAPPIPPEEAAPTTEPKAAKRGITIKRGGSVPPTKPTTTPKAETPRKSMAKPAAAPPEPAPKPASRYQKRVALKSPPKPKTRKQKARTPILYAVEDRMAFIEIIAERMEAGQAMYAACLDPALPSLSLVRLWAKTDTAIFDRLARAREGWLDAIDHQILEMIHDDARWEDVEEVVQHRNKETGRTVIHRASKQKVRQVEAAIRRREQMQASINNKKRVEDATALRAQTNEALMAAAAAAQRSGGERPKVEVVIINDPDKYDRGGLGLPEPDPIDAEFDEIPPPIIFGTTDTTVQ